MQGDLPIIPGIDIRRAVPQELFADYCRAADVVVFPSRYEGFGFIPLESLACGAKLVSAKVGVFHDFAPKNWFEAKEHSVQEFAHQLGRALTSGPASTRAFTEIKRRFSLEKYASEFNSIAQSLIRQSAAPTHSSEGLHA
jgi:glycosyltransferase involved in cell wall biosynthesis